MSKNHSSPQRRHVVPSSDGGWRVVGDNHKRASTRTDTKQQAIDAARAILRRAGGGELTIHNRDGRISDSDTVAPGHESRAKDTR